MTCDNPRCQHEFCCLCLHDRTSALYNASFCNGSAEASHSEVLAPVERQICSNRAQQAHNARPAEDTYAEEVLQRVRVALTTRLESNEELFLAEVADAPLRWRRFLEFYDHRETRIRATAQVVFADVVDSHRAQQELIELLSWLRDRWWLRLSPEGVDSHNESVMDPQTFLELPCPVRRRMHAERALHFGSQLVEYERNMVRARHDEEQSVGLWRIEMANALAQAAAEHEAAVARCRFLVAAALDNARVHAENRCERLEEGSTRERDRAAVAELVLADRGVLLREEQAMVSEFQDTARGMQVRVDEFVEQCAESTKRVIDQECSDVKKHERDLVENAEALAWHEENVVTELRRELQEARMQVSRGSGPPSRLSQGTLEQAQFRRFDVTKAGGHDEDNESSRSSKEERVVVTSTPGSDSSASDIHRCSSMILRLPCSHSCRVSLLG